MDPIRVLIIATRYPTREQPNFGHFVERAALALSERPRVEVRVIAPGNSNVNARVEDRGGIKTYRLPVRGLDGPQQHRPGRLARAVLPLVRNIRAEYVFDVICAEFAWPDGPAAATIARALRAPVLIKARGMDFERRLAPEPVRQRLLRGAHAATALVAVSHDMRDIMVAAGLPSRKIHVVYGGVDTDRFAPFDRAAAKAALAVDGPLLLCVGNLISIKGQDLAIAALARLPEARLFIVGDGPEAGALRRLAQRLGVAERVRFFGSLPNALLPRFYVAADVTVHASHVEGFPNVRLESLACGTPLVTTAVGSAAEVIRTAAAGRIIPPDPIAIAEAVRALMRAPSDAEAVRAAIFGFTWKKNAEQLSAILASIVARPA